MQIFAESTEAPNDVFLHAGYLSAYGEYEYDPETGQIELVKEYNQFNTPEFVTPYILFVFVFLFFSFFVFARKLSKGFLSKLSKLLFGLLGVSIISLLAHVAAVYLDFGDDVIRFLLFILLTSGGIFIFSFALYLAGKSHLEVKELIQKKTELTLKESVSGWGTILVFYLFVTLVILYFSILISKNLAANLYYGF